MRSAMMTPEQTGPDTRHGMILYMENVSVSFDGFKALNDLNLYIKEGELRCLIGANGGRDHRQNPPGYRHSKLWSAVQLAAA